MAEASAISSTHVDRSKGNGSSPLLPIQKEMREVATLV